MEEYTQIKANQIKAGDVLALTEGPKQVKEVQHLRAGGKTTVKLSFYSQPPIKLDANTPVFIQKSEVSQ